MGNLCHLEIIYMSPFDEKSIWLNIIFLLLSLWHFWSSEILCPCWSIRVSDLQLKYCRFNFEFSFWGLHLQLCWGIQLSFSPTVLTVSKEKFNFSCCLKLVSNLWKDSLELLYQFVCWLIWSWWSVIYICCWALFFICTFWATYL